MRIYTRTGDDGTTGLQGGLRVQKTDARITAYGAIDEVNASIGVALAEGEGVDGDIRRILTRIQGELFDLGADLSNPDAGDGAPGRISGDLTGRLEGDVDAFEGELEPLANFILPGGSRLAALLHHARTVTRRAETRAFGLQRDEKVNPNCTQYLNRLSDLLFVMARAANKRANVQDTVWTPRK